MNHDRFIEQYIAAFLGAWAANLTTLALPGWQKTIVQHPPVEDAVYQAEETWERLQELTD